MTDFRIENEGEQPNADSERPPDTYVVTEDIYMIPVSKKGDGKFTFHYSLTSTVARDTLMEQVGKERGYSIWKLFTELDSFQHFALSRNSSLGAIRLCSPPTDTDRQPTSTACPDCAPHGEPHTSDCGVEHRHNVVPCTDRHPIQPERPLKWKDIVLREIARRFDLGQITEAEFMQFVAQTDYEFLHFLVPETHGAKWDMIGAIAEKLAGKIVGGEADDVLEWLEAGRVRVDVHKIFPDHAESRTTMIGRRNRLRKTLVERLSPRGWDYLGRYMFGRTVVVTEES